MKDLTVSRYKDNLVAKKSRSLLSILFDYFLQAILLILLFVAIGTPVYQNLPSSEDKLNKMNLSQERLNEIVSSTKLLRTEGERLETMDSAAQRYLLSLARTSYYYYEEQFPYAEKGSGVYILKVPSYNETLMDKEDTWYVNDDIRNYFELFRKEKMGKEPISLFLIYSEDYLDFVSLEDQGYFSSLDKEKKKEKQIESDYQVLTLEKAKEVMNAYVYNDSNALKSINILINHVEKVLQQGIDEVEDDYLPFKEEEGKYNSLYASYEKGLLLVELLSYLLAYVLIYLAYPLSQIPFTTVGQKSLHLALVRKDEMNPTKMNIFIYLLLTFILNLSSLAFPFFVNGMMSVLSFPLAGSLSLFGISMIFLGLDVISLALLLMLPAHQDLSLVSSGLILKDKEAFEAKPVSDDVLEKKEDHGKQE